MQSSPKSPLKQLIAVVAVMTGLLLAAGCTSTSTPASNTGTGSSEASLTAMFPGTTPKPSQAPPPPMLKDPRTAVNSYILWVSYAYRTLHSDVASKTFDPYEEVRVNSYVQYNIEQGRAIDQRLLVGSIKNVESKGSTATVALHEEWAYRYISMQTHQYNSPVNTISYETTYTLVKTKNDEWVVHSVEATSATTPK